MYQVIENITFLSVVLLIALAAAAYLWRFIRDCRLQDGRPIDEEPIDEEPVEDQSFIVRGQIVSHELRGLPGLRIVAVDKNIDGDRPLGTGTTEDRGVYEIRYLPPHLTKAKEKLDVQVQVFGDGNTPIAVSAVRYNANPEENDLNIVISADQLPRPAEYPRLLGELGPHLNTQSEPELKKRLATLREDDEQQDITYLANKTGWDARMVAMTSLASQFSQTSGIEPEFYYALFRSGVPANETILSQMAPETVQQAWERAVEAKILPEELRHQIPENLERFKAHSISRLLDEPTPVGISNFKALIENTLPEPSQQQQFTELYYQRRDNLEEFWTDAKEEFGTEVSDRLELDGKLAFLTINNAPLIQQLHAQNGALHTPLDLVRQGLYQESAWEPLLSDVSIPDEIPGEQPAEQKTNYAAVMAHQLRLSYPTAVVSEMVKVDDIPLNTEPSIKHQVTHFLDENQGKFELGLHPVEQYLNKNEIQLETPVLAEIKKLQRVYQISPSDESMGKLLERKLNSAYDVVRYDEQAFIHAFKDELGGEAVAKLIYAKAHQVHHTVLNVTTSYFLEKSALLPYAITNLPALNEVEENGAIATFSSNQESGVIAMPTLEKVFGEMDYCACEHCRSWLSPAAYLVDLLQFIDLRRYNSAGEELPPTYDQENPVDMLLDRRPDIQHLQLTCENTNTVLPYIDLVNEVLEHYVVNNSLETFTGHNIEAGMTTEELLANPQFVNDAAYVELRNNLFPPPLPFHQPLEVLRRHFEHFEMPLHQAMERLRQNDHLDSDRDSDDPAYDWQDILMERLRLSRLEYRILTDSSDSSLPLETLYGEEVGIPLDPFLEELSSAKHYARLLNLTYDELIEIIRTQFINPHTHLLPKLEKLFVSFATLQAFFDGSLEEPDFGALLPISDLDVIQYGGNPEWSDEENLAQVIQWIRDHETQIRGLIVLSAPASSETICSFDTVKLGYALPLSDSDDTKLQPIEFLKLLRFVRLWRKLGWTIEQTDKAIAALYPADHYPDPGEDWDTAREKLDAGFQTLILRLAHLQIVMELLKLAPQRDLLPLLACWSTIDTQGYRSLYRQMFLNPTILGLDDVFQEDGYGNYLAEKTEYQQPGVELPKLLAHAQVLRAAFNLTQEELDLILQELAQEKLDLFLQELTQEELDLILQELAQEELDLILQELGFNPNMVLDLANVSAIFRHGFLARRLHLSVRELLALKALSGLDPFLSLDITEPEEPLGSVRPESIRFIELVQQIKASPFRVSQLVYFLRHNDWSGKSSPSRKSVLAFARMLRNDLLRIEREHGMKDDPDGEIARTKMVLVYGSEATDVFFGLLNNTSPFSVTYDHGQPALEDDLLAVTERLTYDDFQKQLSFRGIMTTAEKVALDEASSATNDFRTAVQALFDAGQTAFAAFFERYPDLKDLYENFADSNDPLEDRMSALLADFLPDLRARLKRQQVRQTVSAQVSADLTQVTPLLENAALLHAVDQPTDPAIDDFLALETQGLSADIFFADDVIGDPDRSNLLVAAINYRQGGTTLPLNPADENASISGVWRGFLEVPDNGFYNFYVKADAGSDIALKLDGQAVTLVLTDGTWRNQGAIELKVGRLYALELTAKQVKDRLVLQWERKGMGRVPIPAEQLYPAMPLQRFRAMYLRLLKVLAIADAVNLSSAELEHFAAHSDYEIDGKGWLNALPVDPSPVEATGQALLANLVALLQYRALKETLKIRDERLLEVLQDPAATGEDGMPLLERVTGWQEADPMALLEHFGLGLPELAHLQHFAQLHDALAVVQTLGIGAATLLEVTTNEPTSDLLRTLQGALRARYSDSGLPVSRSNDSGSLPAKQPLGTTRDWLNLIQPINDELRSLQRDALVSYVLHRMGQEDGTEHIDTPDKLFEYFLIDVEMDPCMKTSRIRQALSSVQLFIQRCLMNLEPQVASSSINAKQWEWMKRYRVWEANRKVFLWPENWLEPELRDNKSPFFRDLESELLQGDITEDAAATAFVHYLEQLDEVAKLEICGMYYEEDESGNPDNDVVHVIARTAGARRTYYYRRQERNITWTPWEKVDLNIEDNPVLPVVWKGRLFLFWLTVIEKAADELMENPPSSEEDIGDIKIKVTAMLNWSEYYHGKWQPVKTSDLNDPIRLGDDFTPSGSNAFVRAKTALHPIVYENLLLIDVWHSGKRCDSFLLYNTHSLPLYSNKSSFTVTQDIAQIGDRLNTRGMHQALRKAFTNMGIDLPLIPTILRKENLGGLTIDVIENKYLVKRLQDKFMISMYENLRERRRSLEISESSSESLTPESLIIKYYHWSFKEKYNQANTVDISLEKFFESTVVQSSWIGHNSSVIQPVQGNGEIQNIYQTPFFFQNHRHVFYVTTQQESIPVGGFIDVWIPPSVVVSPEIPPILVIPDLHDLRDWFRYDPHVQMDPVLDLIGPGADDIIQGAGTKYPVARGLDPHSPIIHVLSETKALSFGDRAIGVTRSRSIERDFDVDVNLWMEG
ncbi:neuraminidase-like domain-containing protein [Nodosilinea sp. P-1105]|uniref:neuraminidase-like domain-containing protein n=1 Tax=Nodosilinea sp. P-1105 TaxID=2546229 RepID=UPI00146D5667|nr:neuraminidase-like domain-containing protein [Nodosilinea sp. P-1105]